MSRSWSEGKTMGGSLIGLMRHSGVFLRSTAGVVLVAFLGTTLTPITAFAGAPPSGHIGELGAETALAAKSNGVCVDCTIAQRNERSHSELLDRVIVQLTTFESDAGSPSRVKVRVAELIASKKALSELDRSTLAEFGKQKQHFLANGASSEVLKRYEKALADFSGKSDAVRRSIDSVSRARGRAALLKASREGISQISDIQRQSAQMPRDVGNLPMRVTPRTSAKPRMSPGQYAVEMSGKSSPTSGGGSVQRKNGELASSKVSEATSLSIGASAGNDYLAPTADVQISESVLRLAESLEHDPVRIYSWVRNNIAFIPTYGSVQGSSLTLDKKSGNAFDTASLLIALLRASGVPARYVVGTIDVPAGFAQNWVGGMDSADAAQTLLATGGIPNNGRTSGGRTVSIQLEHVWVEALVDFMPSRRNKNQTADTWVPLDASYKQYDEVAPTGWVQAVPFDTASLLADAAAGAIVNEQEGWTQLVNQELVRSQFDGYYQRLNSFLIQTGSNQSPTVLFGARTIHPSVSTSLAASLPYRVVVAGARFAELPDSLRHKFRYSLFANASQRSISNATLTFEASTPSIAGKKLTLAFVPATQLDSDTLASFLPAPHIDGSYFDAGELPSLLPAYAIHVTAELRVDDVVVARGGSFPLGTEMIGEGAFTTLDLLGWDTSIDRQVAGQVSALGLSLQGIGPSQLTSIETRLEAVRSKLLAGQTSGVDVAQFNSDVLSQTATEYFASLDGFGEQIRQASRVADYAALSYGFFHAKVAPISRYGVVFQASYPGLQMDIGHIRRVAWSRDNDHARWVAYNEQRGLHASTMEHIVPELVFNSPEFQVRSVSAVEALNIASEQGQKIYRITSGNVDSALSHVALESSIESEIRSAAMAGKIILTSEREVEIDGFIGVGYIITDPDTGASAYLISGGANGSETGHCAGIAFNIQILLITLMVLAALAAIVAAPILAPLAVASGEIISSAVAGIASSSLRQALAASLVALVGSTAAAGPGLPEICPLAPGGDRAERNICQYRCASDGFSFALPPISNWCSQKSCRRVVSRSEGGSN